MHTVDVIPLVRLPWNAASTFTYSVPATLHTPKLGAWVWVPFRTRMVRAVIANLRRGPSTLTRILPLERVSSLHPLPPLFVQFLLQVAMFTLNHPARFLSFTMAKQASDRNKSLKQKKCFIPLKNKTSFVWWSDDATHERLICKRIQKFNRGHHLILAPTIESAERLYTLASHYRPSPILVSPSAPSASRAHAISAALNSTPNVFIGTRASLFLPFSHLQAITMDEEEHWAYRQESPPPRYHARTLVHFLSETHHTDLCLVAHIPSIDSYHAFHPAPPRIISLPSLELIDLTTIRKFDYPLAPDVLKRIIDFARTDRPALIITTERGYAPLLQCEDCYYLFRCHKCRQVLSRESKELPSLHCNRCGDEELIPPFCPSCQGVRLNSRGFGPGRLIEYLAREGIAASESRTTGSPRGKPREENISFTQDEKARYRKGNEQIKNNVICIVTTVHRTIPNLSYCLVICSHVDALLARPSYTASFDAFHSLSRFQFLAKKHHAPFIVQTAIPDHPLFVALGAHTKKFYEEELSLRRTLSYPPFTRLISITIPAEKSRIDIDALRNHLTERLMAYCIEILPSPRTYRRKKRIHAFTLRIPASLLSHQHWYTIASEIKSLLPTEAIVEVDPDRI